LNFFIFFVASLALVLRVLLCVGRAPLASDAPECALRLAPHHLARICRNNRINTV